MIRIEKENWLPNLYARVHDLRDILRAPSPNFTALSRTEINQIRNTQALPGDTVRVLGHHDDFCLVMKNDGAKGWMLRSWIQEDPSIKDFETTRAGNQNAIVTFPPFSGHG